MVLAEVCDVLKRYCCFFKIHLGVENDCSVHYSQVIWTYLTPYCGPSADPSPFMVLHLSPESWFLFEAYRCCNHDTLKFVQVHEQANDDNGCGR